MREYEMPWRPAYEFSACVAWLAAIALLVYGSLAAKLPSGPIWYMSAVAVFFAALNFKRAWYIWSLKFGLSGVGVQYLRLAELKRITQKLPGQVWLGKGFDWRTKHTQRIYDLKRLEPTELTPPRVFLRIRQILTGKKVASLDKDSVGAPWIHGVEPNEQDVHTALDNLVGNTLIVGTTRCGKTRLLDVLQAQIAFLLTACLIAVDPKGDVELRDNMRRAAQFAGRDYREFNLAFPSASIRIDPLKNYNNISELATRVAALVPSDSGSGDAFTAFAWDVSNAIFLGLDEIGEKATLVKLRRYVESGVEPLLAKCVPAFFAKMAESRPELVVNWEGKATEFINKMMKKPANGEERKNPATPKEILAGHLLMYEALYKPENARSEAIEALAAIYKHDVTHYGKMLANFKPMLAMLTTGELGALLSPDVDDISDEREATDMLSLTDSGASVYIGLNALADKTVASAIGSMLLSDLAAVAAMRYNFRNEKLNKERKIYLMVDEAAQVVNDPYIQILNMAGGAGFVNIAATQTVPDFTARLGSEDKARVMLGNFNNLIALRSKDRTTQDFITETFGDAYVQSVKRAQGTNSSTEKNLTHFGGSVSESLSDGLEAKFPTELLGMMQNWNYIASISGGRLVKGRVPILVEGRA